MLDTDVLVWFLFVSRAGIRNTERFRVFSHISLFSPRLGCAGDYFTRLSFWFFDFCVVFRALEFDQQMVVEASWWEADHVRGRFYGFPMKSDIND